MFAVHFQGVPFTRQFIRNINRAHKIGSRKNAEVAPTPMLTPRIYIYAQNRFFYLPRDSSISEDVLDEG